MLIKNRDRKVGYFRDSEFYSPTQKKLGLTDDYEIDSRIVVVANYLRFITGIPININSAGRTPDYNASVGGSLSSYHLITDERKVAALDLSLIGYKNDHLKKVVMQEIYTLYLMGVRGIGFYSTFVHLDVRPTKDLVVFRASADEKKRLLNGVDFVQNVKNKLGIN